MVSPSRLGQTTQTAVEYGWPASVAALLDAVGFQGDRTCVAQTRALNKSSRSSSFGTFDRRYSSLETAISMHAEVRLELDLCTGLVNHGGTAGHMNIAAG